MKQQRYKNAPIYAKKQNTVQSSANVPAGVLGIRKFNTRND